MALLALRWVLDLGLVNCYLALFGPSFSSRNSAAMKLFGFLKRKPETPRVAVISHPNPTRDICFDGLLGQTVCELVHINPFERGASELLASCDIAIFVRHIFLDAYANLLAACRQKKIPHYLLSDDNFTELAKEQNDAIDTEIMRYYEINNFRNELKTFSGILSSSAELSHYFLTSGLHGKILHFSAVIDRQLSPSKFHRKDDRINVCFFGGKFRATDIDNIFIPVRDLSAYQPVTLYARDILEPLRQSLYDVGVSLVTTKANDDFKGFVRQYQGFNIDIVLHPPGETKNIKYKTANALLVSHYLGAVPIIANEPAYRGISDNDGAMVTDGSILRVNDAMRKLRDGNTRSAYLEKLSKFCTDRFSPEENIRTLRTICVA